MSSASNLVLNDPPLLKSGDRARAAFRPPPATTSTTSSSSTPALKSGETLQKSKKKRDSRAFQPETQSSPAAASSREVLPKSKKRKKQQDQQPTTASPASTTARRRRSASHVAASTALLEQFQPAPLSRAASNVSFSSSSPVLWLFQFPLNFDVNEFTQHVQLEIPQHCVTADEAILTHFTMQAKHYSIIECHKRHAAGLINLFPAAADNNNDDDDDEEEDMLVNQSKGQSTSRLSPGTPFTRVFQIVQNASPAYYSYISSEAAVAKTLPTPEPVQQALQVNFAPIGFIKDQHEHMKNGRRGHSFQPVHYDICASLQTAVDSRGVVNGISKEHQKHKHKHKHHHVHDSNNNHTSQRVETVKKEKKAKREKQREREETQE